MAFPSPAFPAAVATDAQLKVANNLVQTGLLVAVNAANTILFVNSTAGFVPNCLVSVDSEIIAIASVVPSPNAQLVVAAGGRGFDGTTAASHSSGAKVSMLIDAWHHNALASEIKAIESFLGPNGQNVNTAAGGVYPTRTYNFTPQSPGGSLSVGSNVITLAPVPLGVNGSDVNHPLYISGGTGTAEASLITGGTAVSGAASGALFLTCANAHSGAWTISSATGGIQEALIGISNSPTQCGLVDIHPDEVIQLHAQVSVPSAGFYRIAGRAVNYNSNIQRAADYPNGNLFSNRLGALLDMAHLQISTPAGLGQTGAGIYCNTGSLLLDDILVINGNVGIQIQGANSVQIRRTTTGNYDLSYQATAGLWFAGATSGNIIVSDSVFVTSGRTSSNAVFAGIRIDCGDGLLFSNVWVTAAVGIQIGGSSSPGAYTSNVQFVNSLVDGPHIGCLYFPASISPIVGVKFTGCHFHNQGINAGMGIGSTVTFDPGTLAEHIQFIGCHIRGAQVNGVTLSALSEFNLEFVGGDISDNGIGGSGSGIFAGGNLSGLTVTGVRFFNSGIGSQIYGLQIGGNLAKSNITGNSFVDESGNIVISGAVTQTVIANNAGIDDVILTVPSATSITLPVNPSTAITGTTTVTTINGGWSGRTIKLIKTDTGSLTVGGGGNVPGTHTMAQNSSLILTFNGTNWY